MVETLRKTVGGRSAVEIVERASAIQRRHFENWIAESTRAREMVSRLPKAKNSSR